MSEKAENWNEFQSFENESDYMAPEANSQRTREALRRAKKMLGRAAMMAAR